MANLSSPLQKPLIAVTAPSSSPFASTTLNQSSLPFGKFNFTLSELDFSVTSLLSPWNLLDAVWTPLAGYPAADFSFKQRITPLSTLNESVVFITLYYAMIVGGREMMRHRKPFKLHTLSLIHNLTLSLGSGFLLALFIEQLVPTLRDRGVLHAICHVDGGWTQPLVLLYYLNYLTKYIELLDTAFLILKKKPLTFLHTYHHGATALLCYTQLAGATTVSWVPITLNLAVHVLMYMYYFLSTLGVRVWWKEWVTRLQIAQFVVDLGFIYFASYAHFVWTYWPWLPNAGSCSADDWAALAGIGVISSYLVLFVLFYHDTYKGREGAKGAKGAKGGGKKGRNVSFEKSDKVVGVASGVDINPEIVVELVESVGSLGLKASSGAAAIAH